MSRERLEFNRGAGGLGLGGTGWCRKRKVLYDRRGHSASAGRGAHRARGGTTGALRAPAMPLEGIWRAGVKGVLRDI